FREVDKVKFRCDRDDLSEALQTVQRGVSNRPGIPALTGVLLETTADMLTLTTTDLEVSAKLGLPVQGQEEGVALIPARLFADMVKSLPQAPVELDADGSQARISCGAFEGTVRLLPAEGEAQALVPERALSEAGRAAAGDEKGGVDLVVDQSQVTFRTGAFTLTSRLIEGQFPNYRQLLPEGYENRLTVSRQQLLDAVKRVGLLARENTPVRMEFNALGVRLSSQSPDLGGAVEAVEARYEGEDITVAFNPG